MPWARGPPPLVADRAHAAAVVSERAVHLRKRRNGKEALKGDNALNLAARYPSTARPEAAVPAAPQITAAGEDALVVSCHAQKGLIAKRGHQATAC